MPALTLLPCSLPSPMSVTDCGSSTPAPAPAQQRCRCRSRGSWLGCSAPLWQCHLSSQCRCECSPGRSCCPHQTLARPGLPINAPLLLPPLSLSAGGSCVGFGQVCAWKAVPVTPGRSLCPRGRVPVLVVWPDVLREHRESAGPRGWVSSCTLCQGHCIGSGCEPAAKWSKRSADKGLFFISY